MRKPQSKELENLNYGIAELVGAVQLLDRIRHSLVMNEFMDSPQYIPEDIASAMKVTSGISSKVKELTEELRRYEKLQPKETQ